MQYEQAVSQVEAGAHARRNSWEEKREIRLGRISDNDFIHHADVESLIVSDCPTKKCDCIICIYNATPEDQEAQDWEVVKGD